jgi:hypothetical protein
MPTVILRRPSIYSMHATYYTHMFLFDRTALTTILFSEAHESG